MTPLLDRKLLFVTGKGGVGKSTIAASLGLLAAEQGKKTLVCEVDAKGNLADFYEAGDTAFDARELQPNLWAMSMDTEASLKEYLSRIGLLQHKQLKEESTKYNEALRTKTIKHGRDIVLGMIKCRIPVIAAVNGPAVGLGCSLAALSDIVYMAETAHFADPHVSIGLVAADGGPLVWPMQISFLQAKEYALTGARISAAKALELGLANHVVPDPLAAAMECAQGILKLPQQAVEATKRLMNMQLERSVTTSLDYANLSEYVSFGTADFNRIVDRLTAKNK